MPVPTATTRQLLASRPPPQRASPRACAWTSLRTRQGSPVAAVTSLPRRVPPQPGMSSLAKVMSPLRGFTTPAEEMPTPTGGSSARSMAALICARTVARTCSPPAMASVGTFSTLEMTGFSPPRVTRPQAILVPPMSTATMVWLMAPP